jgi:hypothetical protein
MDVCLLSVVCCQVEVSATGWSLVQGSLIECGVSECDREAWIMRRPWLIRGCCAIEKNYYNSKGYVIFTEIKDTKIVQRNYFSTRETFRR